MTVDEELLQELGTVSLPPVVRPSAEIAARAVQIRRRKAGLQAGAAGLVAAAAAASVLAGPNVFDRRAADSPVVPAVVPGELADPQCPQPGGRRLTRDDVADLLVVPPGSDWVPTVAAEDTSGCGGFGGVTGDVEGDRVHGRITALPPTKPDPYRGREAEVPGRHETVAIAGREVDLWTVPGEVDDLYASWTRPDGERWAVLALDFRNGRQYLTGMVEQIEGDARARHDFAEPVADGVRYAEVSFGPPRQPCHLRLSSAEVGPMWPPGSREVDSPGFGTAWWRETDGVGRLDWTADLGPGELGSRSLWGEGLTLAEAQSIARSLQPPGAA